MRVDNTASDLMSILQKKYDRGEDETDKTSGFAAMLANFMGGAAVPQTAPAAPAAGATSSTKTRPLSDGGYTPPSGYEEFRNTILNAESLEYTDDMLSYDPELKTKMLNKEGREYTYKTRIDNAKSIIPSSIAEARERSEASRAHLEKYTYDLFEKNDIKVRQSLGSVYMGTYNPWGLGTVSNDQENFNNTINSPEGREVAVLSEEYTFYSAIAHLADKNPKFAKEFDADPNAAVEKYTNQLGSIMNNWSEHPPILTTEAAWFRNGYLPEDIERFGNNR